MTPTKGQRDAIVELVGIPFSVGGRGPGSFDCLGLTVHALEILRPDLEDLDPWRDLADRWRRGWRPVPGECFPPGFERVALGGAGASDVLLVGHDRGDAPTLTHVDLLLWGGLVLRTREKTGATIEPLERIVSRRRFGGEVLGAMRPPPPVEEVA